MKLSSLIWIWVLLLTLCSITNRIFSGDERVSEEITLSLTIPQNYHPATISDPGRPSFPVAELGGINWTCFYKDFSSRVQRTINPTYDIALKNNDKEAIYYSEMLAKHRYKYYHTSISPITFPTCEYYVFALRHIII